MSANAKCTENITTVLGTALPASADAGLNLDNKHLLAITNL
jgi:hypothetical protein